MNRSRQTRTSKHQATEQAPIRKRTGESYGWLPFLLLAIVGLLIYSNIFSAPFILDSENRIRDNWRIRTLWPPWDWMTYSQRPVAYLSFALNYAVGGNRVWGYHLVNLAIHVTAAGVLLAILQRTLRAGRLADRYRHSATSVSFAIALMWLVHPLQTQSVTYTVQRMESLMGLFYLLTLFFFVCAHNTASPARWLAASAGCCWLGMVTKEVMASAPLIVLWYDRLFVAKSWREVWTARRWYYLSLSLSWLLLGTLMTQWGDYGSGAVVVKDISPRDYVVSQPGIILHYLRLCFLPIGQCLDYGWPVARRFVEIVPPALVIGGLVGVTIWSIFRRPEWSILGGWFFLILAPTSSVMPIADLAFEHRMYLPLAAVCTVAVLLVFTVARKNAAWRSLSARSQQMTSVALLVLVAATLGGLTYRRNQDYRTAEAIWRDVVQKAPHHARGYNNLGNELQEQGKIDQAISQFNLAIRFDPDHPHAYHNLGKAYLEKGRIDDAIEQFEKALRIYPNYAKAHVNLGNAFYDQGKFAQAAEHFNSAIQIDPADAMAHYNLGATLVQQGRFDEAIRSFESALRIDPNHVAAHTNLASLLAEKGHLPEALQHLETALHIDPQSAKAHCNLAVVLHFKQGMIDNAIPHYKAALRIEPNHVMAHSNLGAALLGKGLTQDGICHLEEALRLDPENRTARNYLGSWHFRQAQELAAKETWAEAERHYREGLTLVPNIAEMHHELGLTLLARGKRDLAIQHFQEAVRLKPDFSKAQQNLREANDATQAP